MKFEGQYNPNVKNWVKACFKKSNNLIHFGSKKIPYHDDEMKYTNELPEYKFEDLSYRESSMLHYEEN